MTRLTRCRVASTGSWKTTMSPRWMAADGRRRVDPSASGELVCLLTRRKSPTRRVDSIDSEGMRKGCAQKVMMKIAMTMRWRRDWNAGRTPILWWCEGWEDDRFGGRLSDEGLRAGIW